MIKALAQAVEAIKVAQDETGWIVLQVGWQIACHDHISGISWRIVASLVADVSVIGRSARAFSIITSTVAAANSDDQAVSNWECRARRACTIDQFDGTVRGESDTTERIGILRHEGVHDERTAVHSSVDEVAEDVVAVEQGNAADLVQHDVEECVASWFGGADQAEDVDGLRRDWSWVGADHLVGGIVTIEFNEFESVSWDGFCHLSVEDLNGLSWQSSLVAGESIEIREIDAKNWCIDF